MNNSDIRKGFMIGIGVMGAVLVVGFATGLIAKAF
jgi:hypothetical protein